ncbi:hypothetical protein PRIPAC_89050 [Pristionchus pacificus]|uniref:Uncharacterized protein n=1 Tax=Pristionchus pacificus TaxID=54126 RepID=A0A2A6CVE5_PRIPA|nr:hypothetical protein PRIPAC_89050 [Pristionchus pacificus]|eukprot:PDM82155.1 hypothetical protein PRIPAC_36548 [Pristionchus pacificus]
MGPSCLLRDVILLALIAAVGAAVDFRISASTIAPFDDLPPDFEAEIDQVAEFAVPRPSLKSVEELLERGEIRLNETISGEANERSGEEETEEEVVKISGDVTTTQAPQISTTATPMTTPSTTTVPTTTTTRAPTTTTTTTIKPTTVSTTTVASTTTTTTKPTPSTTLPPNLKIDFRGIPRELLTSEEIEEQERQEDEELQKALKLLPEKEIGKKKLQEETFFAFSEGEETETVDKDEGVSKDDLPPSPPVDDKKVLSLNKIFDEDDDDVGKREAETTTEKTDLDMLGEPSSAAPVTEIVELRTTAPTTTTMVPANLFARNMPQNFEQFTFQVGRNFVPRQIFMKPKDGVSALIDMAIPQLPKASPLIGKEMVEIDLPVRIPEFATTTPSTTTRITTTTSSTTTTAAPTTTTIPVQETTVDFKFPFVVPDGIKSEDKKKSIEESLKEIKDAFKRIRQLVREDGKEDGSEMTSASAEDDFMTAPPPPSPTVPPTTVRTTRTTTVTTTPAPTTTTTVPTTTTTSTVVTTTEEEQIKAGDRPSWLDLSVFAENHKGFFSTTTLSASSTTSTTTTSEEPTTTPTESPPQEALLMQAFAATEKKKDEQKEAVEKKEKESEFGGNIFDEIAERGDAVRFSTAALPSPPPTTARSFSPPLPSLPESLTAEDGVIRQVTRRPRDQSAPPKAPSLQQEVLPKAFRSLVDDLESEAETQRLLMEQLKLEEAQLTSTTTRRPRKRVSRKRITTTTTTASPAFLDGALTNEVDEFFDGPKEEAKEKVRTSGRVLQSNSIVAGARRRLLKGRRKGVNEQQQKQLGEIKHARIVRTQKRLVLVPEEEEIGKWVESQERVRQSKQTQALPPVKGAGRTTPPPVFSIGDPAKMRTTPGPLQAISITSRPYFNVNSRMHVQQLQPQPDGTLAVRQFEMDSAEHIQPQERRAIVEPRRPLSRPSSHTDPLSARARDTELAMQRIASQIADKMFPSTKALQQVQPIRPVPLAPPRHTIRIGKRVPSPTAVPLAVKRTVDSSRVSIDASLDPISIDPRTVRVRNRRNKHVVGISRRRKYTQGQAGASHRIVLHADPSLPVGAIEVPGLIRGERSVHEGERQLGTRSAPIKPPVLHPLVVDRNYDRQTIDRDIRL